MLLPEVQKTRTEDSQADLKIVVVTLHVKLQFTCCVDAKSNPVVCCGVRHRLHVNRTCFEVQVL